MTIPDKTNVCSIGKIHFNLTIQSRMDRVLLEANSKDNLANFSWDIFYFA